MSEKTIISLLPHPIRVRTKNFTYWYMPEGQEASVEERIVQTALVYNDIPLRAARCVARGLPRPKRNTCYIVPLEVQQAVRAAGDRRDDLLSPDGPVEQDASESVPTFERFVRLAAASAQRTIDEFVWYEVGAVRDWLRRASGGTLDLDECTTPDRRPMWTVVRSDGSSTRLVWTTPEETIAGVQGLLFGLAEVKEEER